jgi:hypothetical protein
LALAVSFQTLEVLGRALIAGKTWGTLKHNAPPTKETTIMKHPIEWHERALTRSTLSATRKWEALARDCIAVEELDKSNKFKKAQIELAIKEKKDGFDEDKYAIKRLCV